MLIHSCHFPAGTSSDPVNIEKPAIGHVGSTSPDDTTSPHTMMFVLGVLLVMVVFLVLQVGMFLVLRHHDKLLKRHRRMDETLEFTNKVYHGFLSYIQLNL